MSDPESMMKYWCDFGEDNERVYILMAFARRKHNEELTNSTEVIFRRIIRSEEDIPEQLHQMRSLIAGWNYTFRIYLTVNARNVRDAYFIFQTELNRWARDYIRGDDAAIEKMGNIDSRWKSTLHSPPARDDQYFHFDLDDVYASEAADFANQLGQETTVLLRRETPNGYHILCEPFNYPAWEPPVEYDDLDTDGMVFVEEVGH